MLRSYKLVWVIFLFAQSVDGSGALAKLETPSVWLDATLNEVMNARLKLPMGWRALEISNTCMYDAWAAYDDLAVGTQLGSALRRPPGERTLANKEKAISYAAHRA